MVETTASTGAKTMQGDYAGMVVKLRSGRTEGHQTWPELCAQAATAIEALNRTAPGMVENRASVNSVWDEAESATNGCLIAPDSVALVKAGLEAAAELVGGQPDEGASYQRLW